MGDEVINVIPTSSSRNARGHISGVSGYGGYLVKHTTGKYKGQHISGYIVGNLAITNGCGKDFCVGDTVSDRRVKDSSLKLIGVHWNGKYVGKSKVRTRRGRISRRMEDKNLKLIRRVK